MSSWERARFVPWSRIPDCPADDLSLEKEKLFRVLKREADQARQAMDQTSDGSTTENAIIKSTQVFRWPDFFKSAAFGGTIGCITGTVFGFMDGMRTVQQHTVVMNASNMAKGRYILQGSTRSAALFGGFFAGFQILRYGVRVAADPGEWPEIAVAGVVSMGALMSQPAFRPSMPYASMLIIMDGVHIIMKQFD
eukprot:Nitzschia sp. Nitz4//scaffold193_size40683//12359//12940//NITZ4_007497-RA/size40683-processed-gene-0.11-mRNA-1//1//CDS//3329540273//2659//frame0